MKTGGKGWREVIRQIARVVKGIGDEEPRRQTAREAMVAGHGELRSPMARELKVTGDVFKRPMARALKSAGGKEVRMLVVGGMVVRVPKTTGDKEDSLMKTTGGNGEGLGSISQQSNPTSMSVLEIHMMTHNRQDGPAGRTRRQSNSLGLRRTITISRLLKTEATKQKEKVANVSSLLVARALIIRDGKRTVVNLAAATLLELFEKLGCHRTSRPKRKSFARRGIDYGKAMDPRTGHTMARPLHPLTLEAVALVTKAAKLKAKIKIKRVLVKRIKTNR